MIPQSIALIVIAVILCRMASCFFVALSGKDSAAWLRVSSWPNGPFAFKIIRMVFAALSGPSRIKPYSIPETTAGNPQPPRPLRRLFNRMSSCIFVALGGKFK